MTVPIADPGPLLVAALEYAARGWPVVPLHTPLPDGSCDCRKATCDAIGKHPRTKDGLKSATTDETKIRRWWGMWPHANLGVRTGEIRPGWYLSVLDVDPRAGGNENLERLEATHGKLPDTRHALTGGGGDHYVFEGDAPMKTTSGRLSSGLDTRGGGGPYGAGYIVAPPSKHASGREYAWELSSPETLAVAPAWLLAMVNGPTVAGGRPPDAEGERIVDGQAGGGGRKKTLHSIGRTMRARGMDAEEIFAALAKINERRCDPPLDEKDVRRMAEQAAKVPPGRSKEWEARQQREREPGEDDDQPATPWWEGHALRWDKTGNLKNTFANLCAVLRFAPTYNGRFSFNEMGHRPLLDDKSIEEGDVGRLREQVEKLYGISPETRNLHQSLLVVSQEKKFHPVRSYLNGLQWDGKPRLDQVATEILGAKDTPLTRKKVRCFFISAVARANKPGCVVHTVLVLVGEQGAFKSSFFRTIAEPWFADTRMNVSNKDAYQQAAESWIYEWPEVEEINSQKTSGEVKGFLTSDTDLYRPPYAHGPRKVPRGNVFVGSTNHKKFLLDDTGNRRWWPIEAGEEINLTLLREWRDQLWAEATVAHGAGEKWHLTRAEDKEHEEQVEKYRIRDPWENVIGKWLVNHWPALQNETGRRFLTTHEVMAGALQMTPKDMRLEGMQRVGRVMAKLGYEHRQQRLKPDEAKRFMELTGQERTRIWAWIPKAVPDDPS